MHRMPAEGSGCMETAAGYIEKAGMMKEVNNNASYLYSWNDRPDLADRSYCMWGIGKLPDDGTLHHFSRCVPVFCIHSMEK